MRVVQAKTYYEVESADGLVLNRCATYAEASAWIKANRPPSKLAEEVRTTWRWPKTTLARMQGESFDSETKISAAAKTAALGLALLVSSACGTLPSVADLARAVDEAHQARAFACAVIPATSACSDASRALAAAEAALAAAK